MFVVDYLLVGVLVNLFFEITQKGNWGLSDRINVLLFYPLFIVGVLGVAVLANMFSFLNSIHEFANSNNIFSQNLDKIMKFTPFNFQKFFNLLSTEENNVDKKKNTKEKNYSKNNINDHSEQLDQLKLEISKLKKKRTN